MGAGRWRFRTSGVSEWGLRMKSRKEGSDSGGRMGASGGRGNPVYGIIGTGETLGR